MSQHRSPNRCSIVFSFVRACGFRSARGFENLKKVVVLWQSHTARRYLTNEIINATIFGFEEQKRRLDAQIDELRAMLSPDSNDSAGSTPCGTAVRDKQGMSAAGRKAIAEAQRKRSAAVEGQSTEPVAAKRPKRRLVRSERLRTPLSHLAAPLTACCEWL